MAYPLIKSLLFLLIFSSSEITSNIDQSQTAFTPVNPSGSPVYISEAELYNDSNEGLKISCSITNKSSSQITGLNLASVLYKKGEDIPKIISLRKPVLIDAGKRLRISWSRPELQDYSAGGLIAPYSIEFERGSPWHVKRSPDIKNRRNILDYPDVGAVSRFTSQLGVFVTNRQEILNEGQPLAVVRDSADSIQRIAQIRLLRKAGNRGGFDILHIYPGKEIDRNDRVRLLFPEMSRLNLNSKSWLFSGITAIIAGGYFHFMGDHNQSKYDDTFDSAGKSFYGDRVESYNRKRDAAFIMGGLNIGASVVTQLIWGRHNKHLYSGINCCNTSTKSLVTFGILSFGSALYFDNVKYSKEKRLPDALDPAGILYYRQQIIINRYRRNVTMLYGSAAFSAALINHFLNRNEMDVYRDRSRWAWLKWNPVSKTNLIYTGAAAAAAAYFITRRNTDNDNRKNAWTDIDRTAAESDLKIHQHRGNAVLIGAGTFLLSGVISQITGNDHIKDSFTGDPLIPLPGFLINRKFKTNITVEPGRNSPGLTIALNLQFK